MAANFDEVTRVTNDEYDGPQPNSLPNKHIVFHLNRADFLVGLIIYIPPQTWEAAPL